jgi:hypothetical protein
VFILDKQLLQTLDLIEEFSIHLLAEGPILLFDCFLCDVFELIDSFDFFIKFITPQVKHGYLHAHFLGPYEVLGFLLVLDT